MPDSNFHTKTPPKLWAEGECLSNYSFFHFLAKLIQIFSHLNKLHMPSLLLKPCNLFFFSCILLLFGWALSFFHALLTLTFSYFHLGGHFLFFNVLLTLMCMFYFQAREFTFSLIHSFTLLLKIAHFKKQPCSRCSLQKSDLEQIALYKRVTVSK